MVVLDTGKTDLREALAARFVNGQYGSNTQEEVTTDTGLFTPIPTTSVSLSASAQGSVFAVEHELNATIASGSIFGEFVTSSGSAVLTRDTLPQFTKQNTEEIITTLTFYAEFN